MLLAKALRGVGETLITVGVVILLFVGYELWFSDLKPSRTQQALGDELVESWRHGPPIDPGAPSVPRTNIGDGIAVVHIPRFGRNWRRVVVEGVSEAALRKGPGHYPGTQLPGQVGNFVVSGHRVTYGRPFNQIDELRRGDPIVVETPTQWFAYDVTATAIVSPTDVQVIAAVPGRPGVRPTSAMLTLTTCHPRYSARQRLIVFARLATATARADGPPPVLAG